MKQFIISTLKENNLLFFGSFFIQCISLTYLLSTIFLWLNIGINQYIFPISLLLSLFINKKTYDCKIKECIWCILMVLLFLTLNFIIYDYSHDGQCYHSGTILQLSEGWNPIFEHKSFTDPRIDLWINHYVRGMETVSASIVSFIDNLDSGKIINSFLLMSSFFYTTLLVCKLLQNINLFNKIWIIVVVVLNPVVINQLFTYYIDYTVYSIILIIAGLLYSLNRYNSNIKTNCIINISLILFFIPSIKFNITFWIVIFMFIYAIYISIKTSFIPKYLYLFLISGLLGVVIGAFNPYITNIIHNGNPFYPLLGEGSVDIMSGQTPIIISDKNIFFKIIYSFISNPANNIDTSSTTIFNITSENIITSGIPETRLGGFGIFFFEASFISILLFLFTKNSTEKKIFVYILLSLFLSLFILPSGWWARYVPFFYFFPMIMIVYLFKYENSKIINFLKYIPLTLLSINILISIIVSFSLGIKNIIRTDNIINELSKIDNIELYTDNISFLYRLKKNNIRFLNTKKAIESGQSLKTYGPTIYIDLEKYNLIYKEFYGIEILCKK